MSASCLLQHALDSGLYPGPSGKTLGVSLESFDSAAGTARAVFTPQEHFCNPFGTIQGGFVAAMLDETLGLALATKLSARETAPTLELKTSFINPALPGTIRAVGRVVSRGENIAFMEGELRDGNNTIIATATATALVKPL